jgi:geranylgeranyl diphosphate synthase type I
MEYHFGWRDTALRPTEADPGKLLRPTLVLLAAEAVQGLDATATNDDVIARAVPAAVAVEMIHNFSLIHDDIEDHDEVRRHRPTLWRIWGQPQAINTGDGLFTMARTSLIRLLHIGVSAELVTALTQLLDRTCLLLCEGQHLDMSFEGHYDVTAAMYLAMIERKTAALMACATEMGARLASADDEAAERMAVFGRALGMGFQLRDDLLGIWASLDQLGKRAAGDLRRKKMSLPVIIALGRAAADDRAWLIQAYRSPGEMNAEDVDFALTILDRTEARAQVWAVLQNECAQARRALAHLTTARARDEWPATALSTLVDFVAAEFAD